MTIVGGQILFFLPAMTLAWMEPDRIAPEGREKRAIGSRAGLAITMVTAVVITPVVLSLSIAVVPVRATMSVTRIPSSVTRNCAHLQARKTVGFGVGAVLHLDGVVCWDGRQATEGYGFNKSDCALFSSLDATVTSVTCMRQTDQTGTLHFTDTRLVRSDLLPWIRREVTLHLTVDRNGRVGEFP
ncbi:MAG TPA: hypothetical protein VIN56_05120 [Candidatus Dormibacteraeota bacterium]